MEHPERPSPPGWTHSASSGRNPAGLPFGTIWFHHLQSGLRVFPKHDGSYKVEFSAPRMLREDNTVLIKSDLELRTAESRAQAIASEIVTLAPEGAYYERIDSTVYVAIAPYILFELLEKRKHPSCHRLPISYPGESLFFPARTRDW